MGRGIFPLLYSSSASQPNVSKLRISVVQYLNTAPLVRGFTHGPLHGKYDLSFTVPSLCADALRTGAADVAIIPAIEYQRIADLVILPDLSIASKERVRSLLLVSKDPIRLAKRIALDRSSRSTQALTKILCANRWNISPDFCEADPDVAVMLAESDAALVIGDPALRLAIAAEAKAKPGRDGEWLSSGATVGLPQFNTVHVYDVVREWWQMTERPAVLAVWAARPEIASEALADEFLASLNFGLKNLDAICKESAAEMNLPEKELKLYLKTNIDYSLDDENRKGLLAYYSHAVKLGLIEKLSPITIAARAGVPARTIDFSWAKVPSKV